MTIRHVLNRIVSFLAALSQLLSECFQMQICCIFGYVVKVCENVLNKTSHYNFNLCPVLTNWSIFYFCLCFSTKFYYCYVSSCTIFLWSKRLWKNARFLIYSTVVYIQFWTKEMDVSHDPPHHHLSPFLGYPGNLFPARARSVPGI